MLTTAKVKANLSKTQKKCAICGSRLNPASREPCLDHNHETGEVRELLCRRCNCLIGYARESPEILLSAVAYLKKHERGIF